MLSHLRVLDLTDGGASITGRILSDLGADDVRSVVQRELPQVGAEAPGAWKPWFPVIDYDRCTNCMQCLSFCLFDVYGVEFYILSLDQSSTNDRADTKDSRHGLPQGCSIERRWVDGNPIGQHISELSRDVRQECNTVSREYAADSNGSLKPNTVGVYVSAAPPRSSCRQALAR